MTINCMVIQFLVRILLGQNFFVFCEIVGCVCYLVMFFSDDH